VLINFQDIFETQVANSAAYSFWRRKERIWQRINDEKKNIFAPLYPPLAAGMKGPSLEKSLIGKLDSYKKAPSSV